MKSFVTDPIQKLEKIYLLHTDYHCFPGGRKKLAVIMDTLGQVKTRGTLRVLDMGCGNGSISLPVASLGHEVVGVDVNEAAIEEARRRNNFIFARFEKCTGQALPALDPFDCAICSEVLEHLDDPAAMVRTLAAALKPDGVLIVTIPNGYGPRECLGRTERALRRYRWVNWSIDRIRTFLRMRTENEKHLMHTANPDQEHVQRFTPRTIRVHLENGGFAVERWIPSFWFLSLFGSAKNGIGFLAELDSWLAEHLPLAFASGWYLICRKKPGNSAGRPAEKLPPRA